MYACSDVLSHEFVRSDGTRGLVRALISTSADVTHRRACHFSADALMRLCMQCKELLGVVADSGAVTALAAALRNVVGRSEARDAVSTLEHVVATVAGPTRGVASSTAATAAVAERGKSAAATPPLPPTTLVVDDDDVPLLAAVLAALGFLSQDNPRNATLEAEAGVVPLLTRVLRTCSAAPPDSEPLRQLVVQADFALANVLHMA